MSNLWGKLLCAMFGHRRGRRIDDLLGTLQGQGLYYLECPRCLATWTRRVKVKP